MPAFIRRGFTAASVFLLTCIPILSVHAAPAGRQIEEVIVTAERRESTVSDTSISITAFTGEFLEDFGIRNQEDLQNLVPAAVIEPYDMAIRGVGRNFRSLGGDPGIATYLNGVYSEDFGIASTEGGLFDVERIEFLRGPQGTLYGRNAIGGAVNFINKQPSEEFEGEARMVLGDYSLQEYYGVVSGPLISKYLQGRLVGTKRTRDGYIDDLGLGEDPNNYGDENYAISLRFTPTDDIELNMRANERSYARRMGGADAAGILNLTENETLERDTETYAWGYRAVDTAVPCPDAFTRTASVPTTGVLGGTGCAVAGMPTFSFTNPETGAPVVAQRIVGGVDRSPFSAAGLHPNHAFGHDPRRQRMIGTDDLDSDDLVTDTSGQQDEFFDQQAVSFDATWDITDGFSVKYIFGYTDYFYDRESDTDLTSSPIDRTFYVSQETEYVSHEMQFFIDPTEDLSITAGLFAYDAKITQRGDFYDYTCRGRPDCESRFTYDFPNAAMGVGFLDFFPKMDLFTAKGAGEEFDTGTALPFYCLSGESIAAGDQLDVYCFGKWAADRGDRVDHGPSTIGTDLEYQTRSERYAYAAFSQGVYQINEQFALTLGLRWARDQLDGEENVFYYAETDIVPLGFGTDGTGGAGGGAAGKNCDAGVATCASSLFAVNQALGYMDAQGNILNHDRALTAGIPTSVSLWRELYDTTEDVTWRVNLDWTPTDDDLIYASATKGMRSGGFNLVFFSSNAVYEPENLIAYELGYKGGMLEGQLQLNSAVYFYDYEDVHTFGNGASFAGGYTTNVVAVPEAEMIGWDADVTWLATDNITIGAHISFTHSEYKADPEIDLGAAAGPQEGIVDPNDPHLPRSLFSANANVISINGNQMIRIPEWKGGAWGMYAWPLGDMGRVEFLANWSYIDQVYFSVFEREDQSAPSYQRVDMRATWTSADDQWMVAGFVNNVLDEIGLRQIEQYGATEGVNYRRTGAATDPRLYGLEVRYKFGAGF